MTGREYSWYAWTLAIALWPSIAIGQVATQATAAPALVPPPATKIEAFKPAAGTVLTFGYNNLGTISDISVDARELRDSKGNTVRGVVVEVTQSQYREERSFIDTDELPELIKGMDALLGVKSNPTNFQHFEVRYTTRGELELTAFGSNSGIRYAVQAGRVTTARTFLDEDEFRKLRSLFENAGQLLAARTGKD